MIRTHHKVTRRRLRAGAWVLTRETDGLQVVATRGVGRWWTDGGIIRQTLGQIVLDLELAHSPWPIEPEPELPLEPDPQDDELPASAYPAAWGDGGAE